MAGWRGVAASGAATLALFLAVCVSTTHQHPALLPPPTGRPLLTTTSSQRQGEKGSGWSLMDTLLRMDDLLQRHNDYNDVMLESGEEDDQLSRLLYRLQHGERVREGWYDTEPTLPPPPDKRLDATTHTTKTQRDRREHRLESTGLARPAGKTLTHKERKGKKTKGKRGHGKRSR